MTALKRFLFTTAAIFTMFLSTVNPSLAQTGFQKIYGSSFGDVGYAVQQTSDSGYIATGYSRNDVYLIKTNSLGDTLWTRTYGGSANDVGLSVQQTSDGGYIIAGYTVSFGAGASDVYLIKTNSAGDTLWTRTYGGAAGDFGYTVEEIPDSGYIIAGYTQSFGHGFNDAYLIRTNLIGDTLWTRTYGGAFDDFGRFLARTLDGGYIITGETISFGATTSLQVYLIKTNSAGDTLWTKRYGGTLEEYGFSVQQTSDSGYIITGYTETFGAGSSDVYLIKTNSTGDTLWTHTYGGSARDRGISVQQTSDSGYIIAGYTDSFGAGQYDVYLIKTNSVGDTLWTRIYGDFFDDMAFFVRQASDGGYIVSGSTLSFGALNFDVYLIKTGEDGFITDVVNDPAGIPHEFGLQQNYPNPFNPKTNFEFRVPASPAGGLNFGFVSLKIFDLLGREITTLVNETKSPGIYRISWDAADRPGGVYFYRLQSSSFSETRKLVLLR